MDRPSQLSSLAAGRGYDGPTAAIPVQPSHNERISILESRVAELSKELEAVAQSDAIRLEKLESKVG